MTGAAWSEKPVGFLCTAGARSSYMSPIGLANSLMFDFRSLIIPRFVYAVKDDFRGGRRAGRVVARARRAARAHDGRPGARPGLAAHLERCRIRTPALTDPRPAAPGASPRGAAMIPVRPRSGARRLGRRDLLRVSPAALAAGLWPPPAAAGQRIPVEAPSDILECAATLAGLEFTAGQRDLMRSDVARNRRRYAALRGSGHRPGHGAGIRLPVLPGGQPPAGPGHAPRRTAGRASGACGRPGQPRRARLRAGDDPVAAARRPAGDVGRPDADVPRPSPALRRPSQLRGHPHGGRGAGAGGRSRPGDRRRAVPRPAARDPVGRQGSVRRPRRAHDVGARGRTSSR